jgi:Mn-dependent DtxR family transcriptional regulator
MYVEGSEGLSHMSHLIRASQEDYLEAVFLLAKRGNVRNIDIAAQIGVSKASVSRAVLILVTDEMVTIDRDHLISLTDKGRKAAERIYEKHVFFTGLLQWAGLGAAEAEREACLMEHAIGDAAFLALKRAFLREGVGGSGSGSGFGV